MATPAASGIVRGQVSNVWSHARSQCGPVAIFTKKAQILHRSQSTFSASEVSTPPATRSPTQALSASQRALIFNEDARPLARLPLSTLLRSLLISSIFTRPVLMRPLMSLLNTIIHSKSSLTNLSNPIFRGIIRITVFDQFVAGVTPAEVQRTVGEIKAMGYQGVILGHTREIETEQDLQSSAEDCGDRNDICIAKWLELNLQTLALVGDGDYINVKLTGAGPAVTSDLASNSPPCAQLMSALDTIITTAAAQGSRIWMDAEQQVFQGAIDDMTIDLMRKYNRSPDNGGGPLVWNTVQAYLRSSRENLARHVKLARAEGWTLGIKLVRGAYIATEERNKVWDTKEGTDRNYNAIVNDVLRGTVKGMQVDAAKGIAPYMWLFAAGHNTESVNNAMATINQLSDQGKPCSPVSFAQLHGMADELSCHLLSQRERMPQPRNNEPGSVVVPKIYKCLSWGSIEDCLGFLMRRAVENASAAERIKEGVSVVKRELRRRVLRF